MRLLALDTSLAACAVACLKGDAEPVMRSELVDRAHGERLIGMVADAMAEAELTFPELDRLAVTIGPGSFTGLRVGIAAIRGFALASNCPVAGIGNLAVHAEAARASHGPCKVLALTGGARGDAYGQLFAADGAPLGEARAGRPEDFATDLAAAEAVAGSAARAILETLAADPPVVHEDHEPDLAALCRLAVAAKPDNRHVRPLYLRPPDAKPQSGRAIARST